MRIIPALAGLALVLAPISAQAALPPQWQRAAELEAVIQAATEALDAPIESITLTWDQTYQVTHDECHVEVQVTYLLQDMPGPQKFEVKAGEKVCPE